MNTKNSGWHGWPFLVVAAMAFGGIPAGGVVEEVNDTLFVSRGAWVGGQYENVYYLGDAGQSNNLKMITGLGMDRGWEPKTYGYIPPTEGSPLKATITTLTVKPVTATWELEFSGVDAKSGTIPGSYLHQGTFRFYTRAPPTGAQNVSNRIRLHPGELNITGFVVQEERWVLIRGIGPSLAEFEVEDPVSDVTITLHHEEEVVASNEKWGDFPGPDSVGLNTVFELAGAFPLGEGTNDSALFLLLDPGAYTVHADSPSATEPGDALVEVFILPYE